VAKSQIFDKTDLYRDPKFVDWLIVHAMVNHANQVGCTRITDVSGWENVGDCSNVEIFFQIDGIDVSFKNLIKSLGDEIDIMISRKVDKIMEEHFNDFVYTVDRVKDEMAQMVKLALKTKLGVDVPK